MPVVDFRFTSDHAVTYNNGLVGYSPALPGTAGLYVIYNPSTTHPVYVGTASDVQDRFDGRANVMREMGFSAGQLGAITVFYVKPYMGGTFANAVFANPGNTGVANGLDLENLLIRFYLQVIAWNVRNIQKLAAFQNNAATNLSVRMSNGPGMNVAGLPITHTINAWTAL
jgi:hypothetical protein